MELVSNKLKEFLEQNKYLCERDIDAFLVNNKNYFKDNELEDIKLNKMKILKNHNREFLNSTLKEKEVYFDNMFKNSDPNIKLDKNQLQAIIADENLLVIAGAGSGKTTTMAAKVKYLVDNGYPEAKILVISFTKKACQEIERIIHDDLDCPNVKVTTFHALGYDIIKKSGRDIEKIIEDNNKYKILSNFIKKYAFKDKKYLSDLYDNFKSYINLTEDALKYETFEEYHKIAYQAKYNKSGFNLSNYINAQIKNRRLRKKTIKGEFLRSKEEVDIANYLYLNGIDYSYELSYNEIINNIKTHPDFFIKQLELENYIEHFGVDQNLDNKMYDKEELKAYLNTLKLKQTYINEYDQSKRFIVTYSKYNDNTTYLENLEKQLIDKSYNLERRSDEEVFKMLMETGTEGYFSSFIYKILIPFISIFKAYNYHIDDFKNLYEYATPILKKQLIVLKPIYVYYKEELERKHYIDFDDMINLSYEIIPTIKESDLGVDYDYLIIDEYQDISNQRYNLTKVLADLFGAKIMAVGDDWQTIYSFSGADINLFKDFKKHVEYAKQIPIENTYRNSQELIDIAGDFIQKNSFQIKKQLKSTKRLANPIEVFYYDDGYRDKKRIYNKYMVNNNQAKAITQIILEIVKNNPKYKILLLGRYEKDKEVLLMTNYFTEYRGKIKSTVIEEANLSFLTIHKAKGLSADAVILVNAVDDILGFPSKIEDIPIIELLKDYSENGDKKEYRPNMVSGFKEGILYPEERRLFYVAMTRTKNKFYIAVPNSKKSMFIKEIIKYNQVIEHKDVIKSNSPITSDKICPKCNYNLDMVNYKERDFFIYRCSNKSCKFQTMFPKRLEELDICPKCGEIVIYCYKNSNRKNIYRCFNRDCDYQLLKDDK